MKAPRIGTEWERYDGARLKVVAVEGRQVHCTVVKRGAHVGSGRHRPPRALTFVRSDFHNEVYDTFLRRRA